MSDLLSIISRGYFVEPEYYLADLPDVIISKIVLPLVKARSLDEEDVVDDRLTQNDRPKPSCE